MKGIIYLGSAPNDLTNMKNVRPTEKDGSEFLKP